MRDVKFDLNFWSYIKLCQILRVENLNKWKFFAEFQIKIILSVVTMSNQVYEHP